MQRVLYTLLTFVFAWAQPGEFLEVDQAFISSVVQEKEKLHVQIQNAPSVYLYADKVALKSQTKGVTLEYTLPKGVEHEGIDGLEMIYTGTLEFTAIINKQEALQETLSVALEYQGCSEAGLCYQPMTKTFDFDISTLSTSGASTASKPASKQTSSFSDEYSDVFNQGFLVVVALFFGFGVLLSLTPCIFPMIPILSSIIVKQGENITTKRAFFLSVVYVLAMAVAYTIAGVLAGLFGANLQAALQAPWVIVLFSGVFVALAFSMFGFYELRMPQFIQNRVTKTSKSTEGNGAIGVAIMGFLSALIVGPCVAAPLAGALIYIGDTGDALLGGAALFSLSIGMGLPLLAVGVGAGKFMPKPGGWMEKVTAAFGVVMLGVAIWLLDRIIDESITMMLYALLLIISSVYIGAFNGISASSGWGHFTKGLGIVILLAGITFFVGALTNGTLFDPLKTFKASKSSTAVSQEGIKFTKYAANPQELDAIIEGAKGKNIMLDFSADWCISCKELDEITFKDPQVVQALSDYILVKVDGTKPSEGNKAIKSRYKVVGEPALRFFDKKGNELANKRINGYVNPTEFMQVINR